MPKGDTSVPGALSLFFAAAFFLFGLWVVFDTVLLGILLMASALLLGGAVGGLTLASRRQQRGEG